MDRVLAEIGNKRNTDYDFSPPEAGNFMWAENNIKSAASGIKNVISASSHNK